MKKIVNYDFLNWRKIADVNDEKIRGDLWKMTFIRKPAAVPFPPDSYWDARVTNYNFDVQDDPVIVDTHIRGFTVIQSAPPAMTMGSLGLVFEDFSDQSLSYCINEWKRAEGDYRTRMSLPKKALTADIRIDITDVNKVIIRSLYAYDCMLESSPFQEQGGGDGNVTLGTQMMLQLRFAYWERHFHNVAPEVLEDMRKNAE